MSDQPEMYGLYGFSHGAARVLTVMSPAGTAVVLRTLPGNADVTVHSGEGLLTRYYEKRLGALERLVKKHGIKILTKAEWDARKAMFGECIYL
jgi:hypothetical protein